MTMSLQQLQAKFLAKAEEKCTGAMTLPRLMRKLFQSVDLDNDGFVSIREWAAVVEKAGGAITSDEACALFEYWDSAGYQREPSGFCAIADAVASLMSSELSSEPVFGGATAGPPSAADPQGNRGNRSSVEGGIFGGGVYESDAQRFAAPRHGAYVPPTEYAQPADMPRGNQSSIQGGIFGDAAQVPSPPKAVNKKYSNASSVPGGIFAADENSGPSFQPKKRNANASSIPGGIFG
tara:strand:- start:976 stop:1683 length:708 start_codon:yes stop_codon:yes gene_type:complete